MVCVTFREALELASGVSPLSTGGNEHCTGTNETNKMSTESGPSPNTINRNEHRSYENKTNQPNINITMATNQNVNAMKSNNIGEDDHGSGTDNTNNIGGDNDGSGGDNDGSGGDKNMQSLLMQTKQIMHTSMIMQVQTKMLMMFKKKAV